MSRIFIDTEFIEIPGQAIDLISIGAVRDDGAEYYAEVEGVDMSRANPWVQANVVPHLIGGKALLSRDAIASDLIEFCGVDPEFWADSPAYDWVALCWLYGSMVERPDGWPYNCYDLRAWSKLNYIDPAVWPEPIDVEHYALADAQHHHLLWEFVGAMSSGFTTEELLDNRYDLETCSAVLDPSFDRGFSRINERRIHALSLAVDERDRIATPRSTGVSA